MAAEYIFSGGWVFRLSRHEIGWCVFEAKFSAGLGDKLHGQHGGQRPIIRLRGDIGWFRRSSKRLLKPARRKYSGKLTGRSAAESSQLAENLQHPPKRFGGTPQQLIPNSKSPQKFRSEFQFMKTADRYIHGAGNGRGSEAMRG